MMRRIRVAQILTSGGIGGAERSCEWHARVFDRDLLAQLYLFLYRGGSVHEAIKSIGFPTCVLRWSSGYDLAGRIRLVQALRAFQPDVIHTHDATPLSRLFIKLGGRCPVVYSEHGAVALNGHVLWRRAAAWIDGLSTDLVVANSRFTADRYISLNGRPRRAVRVIYLGIEPEVSGGGCDPKRFSLSAGRTPNSPLRVGFVGRMEVYKGALQLPLIASALLRRGVSPLDFVVVGEGPAVSDCVDLSRRLGVGASMRFLGWRDDVLAIMATFDVLAVPSLWEAFGLVPLQALAVGTPVVAYDTGGMREPLADAPDAILVPKGDVEAMVDAILELARQTRGVKSSGAKRYVQERFDIHRTARELEGIYLELTEGARTAPAWSAVDE